MSIDSKISTHQVELRERTCTICNKGGSTTPVTLALQWLGIGA